MKITFHNIIFILFGIFLYSQDKFSVKNILLENEYSLDSFYVGATLNHSQLNTKIEELFLSEFSYSTPENCAKQAAIHPSPGVWRWQKIDDYLDFAAKNDIVLRIHGPISPQASRWAKEDKRNISDLIINMEEFLKELCLKINNHPMVKWMDVVNETVERNGEWFREKPGNDKWENPWTQIGLNEDGIPLYIIRAFEIANQYAPNIKYVYNQHGGMEEIMWEKVLNTIIYLKNKGLKVDGIGWQAHLKDFEDLAFNKSKLDYLAALIDWTHSNGMEFHITEMDYRISEVNPTFKSLNRQAAAYSNIMKILISRKNNGVLTFNTWGMVDRPGKHTNEHRFLFDKNLKPKPALFAIKKALIDKSTSLVIFD